MTHMPTWFKALVYSEVALQLPFFFVASYAYLGGLCGVLWVGYSGQRKGLAAASGLPLCCNLQKPELC